jgi:fluoride ion exporter CrcB/FEX
MHIVLIGIGGSLGAVARYAVDGWVSARFAGAFLLGTLIPPARPTPRATLGR